MISNERLRNPDGLRHSVYPHPPPPEETIRAEKVQIERKTFILSLKENPRGRFLRITEDVGGRRDHIIIPASGLDDFRRLLEGIIKTDRDTPTRLSAT